MSTLPRKSESASSIPPSTVAELSAEQQAEIARHYECHPILGWLQIKSGACVDERALVARFLAHKAKQSAATPITTPTPVNDNAAKVTGTVAAAVPPPVEPVEFPPARVMPLVDMPTKTKEPAPAYTPKADGTAARATGGIFLPSPFARARKAPRILESERKVPSETHTFAVDMRNLLGVAVIDVVEGWGGLLTAAYMLKCNGSDDPWSGTSTWGENANATYLGASKKVRKDGTSIAHQLCAALIHCGFVQGPLNTEGVPSYRVVPYAERMGGVVDRENDRHHLAWFSARFARGHDANERPVLWEMKKRFGSAAHMVITALCHQLRSRKAPGQLPSDAVWRPYSGHVVAGNGPISAWAFASSGKTTINAESEFAKLAETALAMLRDKAGAKTRIPSLATIMEDLVTIGVLTPELVMFEIEHNDAQECQPNAYATLSHEQAAKISDATVSKIAGDGDHDKMADFLDEHLGDSIVLPVQRHIERPELRAVFRLSFLPINDQVKPWLATVVKQAGHMKKNVELADGLKPVTTTWKRHMEQR